MCANDSSKRMTKLSIQILWIFLASFGMQSCKKKSTSGSTSRTEPSGLPSNKPVSSVASPNPTQADPIPSGKASDAPNDDDEPEDTPADEKKSWNQFLTQPPARRVRVAKQRADNFSCLPTQTFWGAKKVTIPVLEFRGSLETFQFRSADKTIAHQASQIVLHEVNAINSLFIFFENEDPPPPNEPLPPEYRPTQYLECKLTYLRGPLASIQCRETHLPAIGNDHEYPFNLWACKPDMLFDIYHLCNNQLSCMQQLRKAILDQLVVNHGKEMMDDLRDLDPSDHVMPEEKFTFHPDGMAFYLDELYPHVVFAWTEVHLGFAQLDRIFPKSGLYQAIRGYMRQPLFGKNKVHHSEYKKQVPPPTDAHKHR
jgi:hypothetical protein